MAPTFTLWDVEHLESMPHVRDMTVGPVSRDDVQEFARRYHYTRIGNGAFWRWGLWHGVTLLGVVGYNLPTRSVCSSLFGEEHAHRVWHMTRLAVADNAPRNSESRLIGQSLRLITQQHPGVWAVLTYAATSAGHIGYVYQATNAIYTGTGGRDGGRISAYTDHHGNRRGTHVNGRFISTADAERLGWTPHREATKHRYVYILGNRTERRLRRAMLRFPELPYPKAPGALNLEDAA